MERKWISNQRKKFLDMKGKKRYREKIAEFIKARVPLLAVQFDKLSFIRLLKIK